MGTRQYYVSFNNVLVGKTMGQGMVKCVAAWGVSKPNVLVMHGDVTDNNATLFYQGYYNQVLQAKFHSGAWIDSGHPAGTWDPPTALTEFQGAFTKNKNINAVLIPNDENAAPIITYLKTHGVKPKTFPTTGQDAYAHRPSERPDRLPVRDRVQADLPGGAGRRRARHVRPCGQDAAGRPGQRVDAGHQGERLGALGPTETPIWVTPANMNDTVVKDNFVPTKQLCSGAAAAGCKAAGIS